MVASGDGCTCLTRELMSEGALEGVHGGMSLGRSSGALEVSEYKGTDAAAAASGGARPESGGALRSNNVCVCISSSTLLCTLVYALIYISIYLSEIFPLVVPVRILFRWCSRRAGRVGRHARCSCIVCLVATIFAEEVVFVVVI